MQAGAVATKGVLGDTCAAGYRERRGMADGGARVPEVLSAADLEGFFAGLYCPRRTLKASSLGSYPSRSKQRLVRRWARM